MIKQLLNSAIAKYRDLSVARRSIICLCLRHRQIIDLLDTDKSRYFAQSRPIIVYYLVNHRILGPVFVVRGPPVSEMAKTVLCFYIVNGYQYVQ